MEDFPEAHQQSVTQGRVRMEYMSSFSVLEVKKNI